MTAAAQRHEPTSLAVWDIPAPTVAGERFTVKVGVKSSANDDLRGHRVEVCNAAGIVIGEGHLGDTRWPGTDALYWADVSLSAPANEGLVALSARCHAAVAHFSIAVTGAPDHTLTLKVITVETAAPIADAELRLGPYRARTDRDGLATLRVCKGSYDLHMWRVGFQAPPATIAVESDKHIEVKAVTMPEENADRAWKM